MTDIKCKVCNEIKPSSEFYTYQYKDKSRKGGILNKCKKCTSIQSTEKKRLKFEDKNKIPDLINEEWKDVVGYEGCYMVSSMGRIKSIYRIVNSPQNGKTQKQATVLKVWVDEDGYAHVTLSKDGMRKRHSVHQVVAKAFIPNPFNLEGVNHNNYIKSDNSKDNLRWMTNPDNAKDAWENNKVPYQKGFNASNVKLTREEVIEIHNSKLTITELSKKMNHPITTIYSVKSGNVFKEITNGISTIVNKRAVIGKDIIQKVITSNLSVAELSKEIGISKKKIHNINYRYNGLNRRREANNN